MDLDALRREYESGGLDVADLDPDPIAQLGAWLDAAATARLVEPSAMTLATVSPEGQPSSRYVLLRRLDERGLAFFTNYDSAKGADMESNPTVAVTFGWLELHRQVRVTGSATRLTDSESDEYFASRPRGSQLGAWASPQSTVLADRAELERSVAEAAERFGEGNIPRPADWGGYLVRPDSIEFWQGRRDRLHDRLRYRREASGWLIERLAP